MLVSSTLSHTPDIWTMATKKLEPTFKVLDDKCSEIIPNITRLRENTIEIFLHFHRCAEETKTILASTSDRTQEKVVE